MRLVSIAAIIFISFIAIATVYANAQMHSYQALYNEGSPNSAYKERMQAEITGLVELQGLEESGQITEAQYQQGMEERCSTMVDIQKEYSRRILG